MPSRSKPSRAVLQALQSTATPWGTSRRSAWMTCRLAHHLSYVRRVIPGPQLRAAEVGDKPHPLDVGSIVHACLQYAHEGLSNKAVVRSAEVLRHADTYYRSLEIDEATRLLEGYWARYGQHNWGWPQGWEIVSVEQLLEDRDSFPQPVSARADLVLRHRVSGRIRIVEHKTRARGFPRDDRAGYASRLQTRSQFCQLAYLVKQHMKLSYVPNVWVNALIKTAVPQYDRLVVKIAPRTLKWWKTVQVLSPIDNEDVTPNPEACAPEMGRPCRYYTWCHETRGHQQYVTLATPKQRRALQKETQRAKK